MPSEIEEARRRLVERELGNCQRAWNSGNARAISRAIALCARWDISPPAWIAAGVEAIVSDRVDDNTSGKGRLARDATRERQDRIHFIRWDAVCEARDRRDELSDEIAHRAEELADGYENKIFAAVSHLLAGTDAAGAEPTIKNS